MYKCDKCNYETHDSGNFSRHKKSKKHIQNAQQITNMNVNKKYAINMQPICNQIKSDEAKFECKYCGNIFKHHQSMYKHMKYRCTDKNEINDLKKQNEKLMDIVQKQTNTAESNAETIKKSMNVLSFVTKQYPDAPPIEELEYDKFNKITKCLMYDRKSKKKINRTIEEIILFHFKNDTLSETLGKTIVEEYKKDNPNDQSMWPRQYSHLFKCEYFLCEKVL